MKNSKKESWNVAGCITLNLQVKYLFGKKVYGSSNMKNSTGKLECIRMYYIKSSSKMFILKEDICVFQHEK